MLTAPPKRTLGRSVSYFRAFRREPVEPELLYELMANDVVAFVGSHVDLADCDVLDVGGGPGYVAAAFERAGARAFTVDISLDELHLHGRSARRATIADGQALPWATASMDVLHCSNVIEHVPDPYRLLDELARVCRPGGVFYLSFTNWFSPWGGHEISPWHYLGGERAVKRYERKGGVVKNVPGESLHRLDIGPVLKALRADDRLAIESVAPRYYPAWTRPITAIPGVREVLTWNLEVLARRRD